MDKLQHQVQVLLFSWSNVTINCSLDRTIASKTLHYFGYQLNSKSLINFIHKMTFHFLTQYKILNLTRVKFCTKRKGCWGIVYTQDYKTSELCLIPLCDVIWNLTHSHWNSSENRLCPGWIPIPSTHEQAHPLTYYESESAPGDSGLPII
jgi:hypothetical protein